MQRQASQEVSHKLVALKSAIQNIQGWQCMLSFGQRLSSIVCYLDYTRIVAAIWYMVYLLNISCRPLIIDPHPMHRQRL